MATQRTFTAEEAQKRFDALPPEIKSIIYTPEVTLVIQKVGEKNHLHYDQMGILDVETSNVLLGFTETGDFPQILATSLHIEKPAADAIAKDINDLLFLKIRDVMKKPAAPSISATTPPTQSVASSPTPAVPKATIPMRDISVIMPSKAAVASQPAAKPLMPPEPTRPKMAPPPMNPAPKPAAPVAPSPAAAPKPAPATVAVNPADMMLAETTVSIAPKVAPAAPPLPPATPQAAPKAAPPKPAPYKTDPYREPPE